MTELEPFLARERAVAARRIRRARMIAGAIGLGVGSLLVWFATHWQRDSDIVPPQNAGPFGFAIATWIAGACLVGAGALFAWRYMKSR